MINGATLQDKVTTLRLRLQNEIYNHPVFQNIFETQLKSVLQVYQYEFFVETNTVKITVNKNNYMDTVGYAHDKAYYSTFVNNALMASLTQYGIINPSNSEAIDIVMKLCTDVPGASYKLFDVTPILNNIIMIYL